MTTLTVRDFRPADAAAAAAAHRAGREHLLLTPEVLTWLNARQAKGEQFRTLVADALRDEPGEVAMDAADHEEFLTGEWARPDFDRDLTVVAVVDGEPAAFGAVQTDGARRHWSAFTACRREFRGRGLSKPAKAESLRRAREAGYRWAYTSNDATNAPMLAINAWLGYQRCASERKFTKRLDG
ncbi:GNAT family N-acetyltransferase [Kitasatospora sp. NPDC059327]|uniref:GNAT family N-acetyltransferase n=1 Tax=Kitasatospora sp. NPDC059327 TaxID=3346803 RepID=UPI00368CE443